jgi:beta-glucosidase
VFLDAARGDDWVGVQAYTRTKIGPDGPIAIPDAAERTLTGWEYYPGAVGDGIRNAWRRAEAPVYVTENGIATADDPRRIDYTTGALEAVESCIADGVDVRGYLHWSALDNYEWGSFRPTFGLIGWDRTTFERHPKPSLAWLGAVSRANALPRPPSA